jgi:MFS family permease
MPRRPFQSLRILRFLKIPPGFSRNHDLHEKICHTLSIGLKGVGLFLFWLIGRGSLGLIPLFVILFGLGSGGMTPLRTPIIRDYFGIKRFGTILGITSIFTTISMVASPPLGGWILDRINRIYLIDYSIDHSKIKKSEDGNHFNMRQDIFTKLKLALKRN